MTDKRFIETVRQFNQMTERIVDDMDGAESAAQVLLLSDGGLHVQGWAEALFTQHIDFDMLAHYQFGLDRIQEYRVVIAPKGFHYPDDAAAILERYVRGGGRLIVEGTGEKDLAPIARLLGIGDQLVESEQQTAAYITIEPGAKDLKEKLGDCGYLPLRGRVGFYAPASDADVLLTWVPPFSPPEFAGLPPERASLPAAHTDVPLCTERRMGDGAITFISFEPSALVREYGLVDHFDLMGGIVERSLGEGRAFSLDAPRRVMMTTFQKGKRRMVHLVNGVGARPLTDTVPCCDLALTMRLHGAKPARATSKIAGVPLDVRLDGDMMTITIPRLDAWDMILIETSEGEMSK